MQKEILRQTMFRTGAEKVTPIQLWPVFLLWDACDHRQDCERYHHLLRHTARRLWVPAKVLLARSPVQFTGRSKSECASQHFHAKGINMCPTHAEHVRVPLKFFIRLQWLTAAFQYLLCCRQHLHNVCRQPGQWDSILVWKHTLHSHVVYHVVYTTWLWLTVCEQFYNDVKLEASLTLSLFSLITIGGTDFICHRKIEMKWKYGSETTKIRTL